MYHPLVLLAGMLFLYRSFYLPSILILSILVLFSSAFWFVNRFHSRLITIFLVGYVWAAIFAINSANQNLPLSLAKKPVIVMGCLINIKDYSPRYQRLLIDVEQTYFKDELSQFNGKVSLGNYKPLDRTITPGWCGEFAAVLKPVHGRLNSQGFDYEAWAYVENIKATGILKNAINLHAGGGLWSRYLHLKVWLFNQLKNSLTNSPSSSLVISLALGDRSLMTEDQWTLLRRTGTSHLLAISGLHIGLMFWMVSIITSLGWRLIPRACLFVPAQKAGWISGLVFSALYLILTGLPLSGRRAWVMLFIAVMLLLTNERTDLRRCFSFALVIILLIWPNSVLSLGFWFSFAAVGLILLQFLSLNLNFSSKNRFFNHPIGKKLFKVLSIQIILSIAMLPLSLLFFGELSLVSPLANIVAIPLISFIVLPCVLIALIFLSLGQLEYSKTIFVIAQFFLENLVLWLEKLVDFSWSWAMPTLYHPISIIFAIAAVFLWLYFRFLPGRWLLFLLIIPLVINPKSKLQYSEFSLDVFDVGQGLAIWIQTADKNLLVDTGYGIEGGFNYFASVIHPVLTANGVSKLDAVVISHGDADHAGGLPALLKSDLKTKLVYSSRREMNIESIFCTAGLKWRWNGVNFEFITQNNTPGENNQSCVLKVSSQTGSVLLPGDIEKESEKRLLMNSKNHLDADVLIVPHHGSQTSSIGPFIDAVSPQLAIFSSGYLNRYGHPAEKVLKRYRQKNIELLNTACQGQITVSFAPSGINQSSLRQAQQPFWRHQCSNIVD